MVWSRMIQYALLGVLGLGLGGLGAAGSWEGARGARQLGTVGGQSSRHNKVALPIPCTHA
eukprot:scaffold23192_cov118-Isochrysis_galbana.AAC.3